MVEPCKLPCGHRYCVQCVTKMFIQKRECPFDRKKVSNSYKPSIDESARVKIEKVNPQAYAERK